MINACAKNSAPPCGDNFTSPYSHEQNYNLEWTTINPKVTGKTKRFDSWATSQVKKMLLVLNEIKVITRSQIIKTFWPCDIEKKGETINRIKKLVNFGALVAHKLAGTQKNIIVYTLGPVGARIIGQLYEPNWWLDLKTDALLKQLIANQFYLRVYRNMIDTKYFVGLFPFTGVVIIKNAETGTTSEFPLIITRGDASNVTKELKWIAFEKAIIVCESIEDIEIIAEKLGNIGRCRFTTDYNLCKVPLQHAFYRYDVNKDNNTKMLVQEFIRTFPENA